MCKCWFFVLSQEKEKQNPVKVEIDSPQWRKEHYVAAQ
jgi:hypothetical protein